MVRKILSILFIVVLLVSLLLGCGEGTTTVTPIELVPGKADMMGIVDLSQIIEDEDIAGLYDMMPKETGMPQTFDEALEMARGETGLDLGQFGELLVFGDIPDTGSYSDIEYIGVIVKGNFKENEVIESIESEMDQALTTISYKGHEIYTDSDEQGGLVFLSSDAFAVGALEAVKDVIAVKEGDQSAISGELLDMYNGLGDGLARLAVMVPPGVVQQAIEEGLQEFAGELPIELPGLEAFADLDTVGMALTKEAQSIAGNFKLCFTNPESASGVYTLISLATMMAGEYPGVPPEALDLLEKLDVSISDSCLDLTIAMTMSEIGDLLAGYATQ